MEKILCLIHPDAEGLLSQTAMEAIAASKKLCNILPGSSFEIGLFGHSTDALLKEVGTSGALNVLTVDATELQSPRYSSDIVACEALIKTYSPTVIIAAGSLRLNRISSGLAHRIGGFAETHITDFQADDNNSFVVSRWNYRQRLLTKLTRTARPWVISLEPGSFTPWRDDAMEISATPVTAFFSSRSTSKGLFKTANRLQTIKPNSKLLFVAGAGWCKRQSDGQLHIDDAENIILDFLSQTDASLGSSKSLIDQTGEEHHVLSFLSHLNQVGQTGSTPHHLKGLSTCCHGEEPHTVGWRFISQRRAINLDASCGWTRKKADVVYVADSFAVIKSINQILRDS